MHEPASQPKSSRLSSVASVPLCFKGFRDNSLRQDFRGGFGRGSATLCLRGEILFW
jgi:hypothetical protein